MDIFKNTFKFLISPHFTPYYVLSESGTLVDPVKLDVSDNTKQFPKSTELLKEAAAMRLALLPR